MRWPRWLQPKTEAEHAVAVKYTVGVTREEFQELLDQLHAANGDLAKVEALIPELQKMLVDLKSTVAEAKRAKTELEGAIATGRRFQRKGY